MSNPKFMQDKNGFCYTWTPELAKLKHLTPYDGEVGVGGFAQKDMPKLMQSKPKKTMRDLAVEAADAAEAAEARGE